MLVRAIHMISSGEGDYMPGDTLVMKDEEAERLIQRGAVESVKKVISLDIPTTAEESQNTGEGD